MSAGPEARLLDATNNRLLRVPDYLTSFVQLQRLLLASNQLTSLPQDLGALIRLKVSRGCDITAQIPGVSRAPFGPAASKVLTNPFAPVSLGQINWRCSWKVALSLL